MRVRVKTFLPLLAEAMGAQEIELDFPGTSVAELIELLVRRYGRKAGQALHDADGDLDPVVQILLNEERWVVREELSRTGLQDGDTVTILMLMAGG